MNYKIYCDGQLIAEFRYSHDRDVAIDALRNEHKDCEFTSED